MPEFDERSCRRIAEAVRRVELAPRNDPGRPAGPRIVLPTRYAIVSEAIGARSGTTLGSGKATLQLVAATTSGGTTTYPYDDLPGADDVVVLSGASESIDVGRLIVVAVVDGYYSVVVDFCS